jgi:oxygen-dependent protoporphyrinogen oxidase
VLGIPTEIMPFVKTGLLTAAGKLRALLDFVTPARKGMEDESIGDFLERRIGREVMERVAEPLLAGIYAGELRKLSLRATFPQFRQAELKHGSLIRGMRKSRKAGAAAPTGLPAGIKNSMFLSFRGGLSTLVQALDQALSDAGAIRRYGTTAVAIDRIDRHGQTADKAASTAAARPDADGADRAFSRYEVELDTGERLSADTVIVTAPTYSAAPLLAPHLDVEELRAIRYVSVANVVLAFDKADFGLEFDGSGFLVPRTEGRHITACTWTSTKWLHTSPADKVLLRCYVGRSGDEASVDLPDDQLVEAVRKDIREILGITAKPLFSEITRLHRSMPQYPVGHVENSRNFKMRLADTLPGVWITGAAFEGVGLPDCIRQGKDTALKAFEELEARSG